MFKRPSTRRNSRAEEINLNLVPILDAMVTLISFLLFSSAFLAIVVIDTPAPLIEDPAQLLQRMKDKPPLNLTLRIQESQMFLEGGFGNLVNRQLSNKPDGQYDLEALHTALLQIKQRYPDETKLILMPAPGVSYETLVQIMDTSRRFEKSDPTLVKKNPKTLVDEPETKLFPEVIFGNLLGAVFGVPSHSASPEPRALV